MKRYLVILTVLITSALSAQIEHVSIGYGPMTFPTLPGEVNPSAGGAAYLAIGGENTGGQIWIAGDSRITYGDKDYGSGAIGLTAYHDINITDDLTIGGFVGGIGFQTYEKRTNYFEEVGLKSPSPFPQPELKKTNFQPFGGLRLGFKFIEVQYAPAGNVITGGVKLKF